MYTSETAPDSVSPYAALGAGSGYELTDEAKEALPVDTKIALALWSDDLQRSFPNTDELSKALTHVTRLDRKLFGQGNRLLHDQKLVQLYVDPKKPQELRLLLTLKGVEFLEEELG